MKDVQKAAEKLSVQLDRYPVESLVDALWVIVLGGKDANYELSGLVSHFAGQLKALTERLSILGDWELITVVSGMDLSSGPAQIADCRFFKLDATELAGMRERFVNGKPQIATRLWEAGLSGFGGIAQMAGRDVVCVRVRAADANHARTVGIEVIRECLNIWCFAQSGIMGFGYMFPEVRWPSTCERRFGVCLRQDVPDLASSQQIGGGGISVNLLQGSPEWIGLRAILQTAPSTRTDVAKRILIAAQWTANAAFATADSIRLVSVATALESIFILPGESKGKKAKLKERISWLLGSDLKERDRVSEKVDELYSVRSHCVHTGNNYVDPAVLQSGTLLLMRCVRRLMTDPPFAAMRQQQEFVDWINAQSGTPPS